MMKAKAAEEERQAGLPKPEISGLEEAAKQHAEELRALEMRLVESHQKELTEAREAATAEALLKAKSSGDNKDEIASAVSAAITEHEKTWTAKQAAEIEAAIERGRMEQVAKGKLKDAQLVRAQKKVKDLEAQILEWRTAGLIPEVVPATPTTTTTPSNPITAASTSTASATPAKTTAPTPLPRKPSLGPAPTGSVVRGGSVPRGTRVPPRGGMGRGAASRPAAPAAAAAAAAASTGGVSIMGAANKRPLETTASDDSLAKRLKPAEGTTTQKPPVTIRRPAPGPPS